MGLGGAVVEVDGADHDHGQRDDNCDGAGDGTADGAQEEDEDLRPLNISSFIIVSILSMKCNQTTGCAIIYLNQKVRKVS